MRVRLRRQGHSPEALEYADVLLADPCSYCGGRADTVDHIVALARNGAHEADNLTAACRSCNSRKRTRPLLEALLCVAFR
jgi:5-methylcytosine-specific restriction endonuclease McrA